jgi:multidrug efflux system membrane fusion protein
MRQLRRRTATPPASPVHHQLDPIDVEFSVPQDRVPEIRRALGRGGAAAGTAPRPHPQHRSSDDGRFSTLDNRSTCQTGTVKAKARFANAGDTSVPEPVRQRHGLLLRSCSTAAVASSGDGRCATGRSGDFVYVLRPTAAGLSVRHAAARLLHQAT